MAQETSARLDTLSRGGGELKQIGAIRRKGAGTPVACSACFNSTTANALRSESTILHGRDHTTNQRTSFQQSKRYSGILSAHQSASAPSVEIFADALLQHSHAMHRSFYLGRRPTRRRRNYRPVRQTQYFSERWPSLATLRRLASMEGEHAIQPGRQSELSEVFQSRLFSPYVNGTSLCAGQSRYHKGRRLEAGRHHLDQFRF